MGEKRGPFVAPRFPESRCRRCISELDVLSPISKGPNFRCPMRNRGFQISTFYLSHWGKCLGRSTGRCYVDAYLSTVQYIIKIDIIMPALLNSPQPRLRSSALSPGTKSKPHVGSCPRSRADSIVSSLLSRSARPNQGVDLPPSSSQRKEGGKTTVPASATAKTTQAEQQQRILASSNYLR